MVEVGFFFFLAVFVAGVLTFLAPCTFPLVPAFLGFISGVSYGEADKIDFNVRRRLVINTVFYVLGFSIVFIAFGILAGFAGTLLAPLQMWLTRIGGLIVIVFGLYLLGFFKLSFFSSATTTKLNSKIKKRGPLASFAFGAAFGAGWTPCVGPILGTVLLLTSTQGMVLTGVVLLAVFSIGLGIPFILTAYFLAQATRAFGKITKYLDWFNKLAGVLLLLLGLLLVTDNLNLLVTWGFRALRFINYEERLLNYL